MRSTNPRCNKTLMHTLYRALSKAAKQCKWVFTTLRSHIPSCSLTSSLLVKDLASVYLKEIASQGFDLTASREVFKDVKAWCSSQGDLTPAPLDFWKGHVVDANIGLFNIVRFFCNLFQQISAHNIERLLVSCKDSSKNHPDLSFKSRPLIRACCNHCCKFLLKWLRLGFFNKVLVSLFSCQPTVGFLGSSRYLHHLFRPIRPSLIVTTGAHPLAFILGL